MRKFLFLLLMIIGIASCRTIPKISPFVEASSEMRKGVSKSLEEIDKSMVSRELSSVRVEDKNLSTITSQALSDFSNQKAQLKDFTKSLDKAFIGMVKYANSINNLAESGKNGEENAQKVANNLNEIAAALTSPSVAAVVSEATGLIVKIQGQIAIVKATKEMTLIMDNANPALSDISIVLKKMVDELKKYNQEIYLKKRQILFGASSLNQRSIDYEKSLDVEYSNLIRKVTMMSQFKSSTNSEERKNILESLIREGCGVQKEEDIESQQLFMMNLSNKILEQKMNAKLLNDKNRSLLNQYEESFINTYLLLDKSKDAIDAWIKAHDEIRNELRKKKPFPNFKELLEIVEDVKALREKVKSLNE